MQIELIKKSLTEYSGLDLTGVCFEDDRIVTVNGEKYPLTPWRYDRRLRGIRHLAIDNNVLRRICSYKSIRIDHIDCNIEKVLHDELDACQWILNDKIVSVYAITHQDKVLSAILNTEKGILCSIEITLTLCSETKPVVRHEIVGKEGMISDCSINEQVPIDSVYLFDSNKKNPESFTDLPGALLGLKPNETAVLDNIEAVVTKKPSVKELWDNEAEIKHLVECTYKSAELGERIITRGQNNETN